MQFDIELVGKIGSMALIDARHHEMDYNKFARLGRQLHPGIIWVTSGATEIGRLDYMRRNGKELTGDPDEVKTDYAAQGQAILMQTYRNFIDARYSVRQVLVEHYHFNDEGKREHIKNMLLRAAAQNAVPIVNYNDAVSWEENRKMEIRKLKEARGTAVELVDNDETAAQIACLVRAKILVILTGLEGIYRDVRDKSTLIREISGKDVYEVIENIDAAKKAVQRRVPRGCERRGGQARIRQAVRGAGYQGHHRIGRLRSRRPHRRHRAVHRHRRPINRFPSISSTAVASPSAVFSSCSTNSMVGRYVFTASSICMREMTST